MSMKKDIVVKKRKKSALPSKNKIKASIEKLWLEMPWTEHDKYKDWYWECNKWCKDLADEKGLDLMYVIGLFSALSPCCSYKQNKIFCRAYLNGIKKHTDNQIAKCDRMSELYGIDPVQVKKETLLSILNGEKTKEFFTAILEPWNTQTVVIDRHMLVIASIKKPTVTASQYKIIKECYLEVAEQEGVTGIALQSSLWSYYRLSKFGHTLYD